MSVSILRLNEFSQDCVLCTHAPERPPSDYELGSTRRGGAGVGVYDPQVYDGQNIGRFINQGGLLEGIKALVASCDLKQGGNLYQPAVAKIPLTNTLTWSTPLCGVDRTPLSLHERLSKFQTTKPLSCWQTMACRIGLHLQ